MVSNSTISISFKIKIADGADGLKKLTVDAKALRNIMKGTVVLPPNLNRRL